MMFSLASLCNPDAFKRENLNTSLQSCRDLKASIKLSSILSFPQSSHLQDRCHVFTTKVSVIFLYMRDIF